METSAKSLSAAGVSRVITTPIYYCNARPHLGHAYGTILADFLFRLCELRGEKAWLITGTDEHGEKMAKVAAKVGVTPQAHCDEYSAYFAETWKTLGLHIDTFYRTSSKEHHALVQKSLQRLFDKGEIYFAEYEGKYCVGCERYRKDSELNEAGLCPDHLIAPELRKEPNYFFKMSKYQKELVSFYEKHPETIQPENYRNEVMGMLSEPLDDLNISRSKERLSWGIELPFDNKFVTYVWFDALLSYLGGMGYTGTETAQDLPLWKESYHTLGKDILKTHSIYWPTMLMSLGLTPPKRLIVNGYWLVKGIKMSKSLGNVVDPITLATQFGRECVRYYLLSEMSFGLDSSMTLDSFVAKVNSDLANGLGNLASRTLTLAHKNFDGKLPPRAALTEDDSNLLKLFEKLPEQSMQEFDAYKFHVGIKTLIEGVRECDRYINVTKPWALAKEGQLERLGTVLSVASECLYKLSILLAPVLPEGCAQLREALGLDPKIPALLKNYESPLKAGQALGAVPRLYARLEMPKDLEES